MENPALERNQLPPWEGFRANAENLALRSCVGYHMPELQRMKSFAFAGLALVAAVSFTACDPKVKSRRDSAPGPQPVVDRPGAPTLSPDDGTSTTTTTVETTTDPRPGGNVIPEPKTRLTPEYGIKIEGKTGYVKSPYDAQGRPIDVRGLPPGTEVEDPYTPGRTLLVP